MNNWLRIIAMLIWKVVARERKVNTNTFTSNGKVLDFFVKLTEKSLKYLLMRLFDLVTDAKILNGTT